MNTTAIGKQAETAAAQYLARKGYRIIEQNWRTRWCEIDIVAIKGDAVSLVEVKYRRQTTWGSGLDYVTPLKRKQMAFAAEFWLAAHNWTGSVYLAAIAVSGSQFEITAFVPDL